MPRTAKPSKEKPANNQATSETGKAGKPKSNVSRLDEAWGKKFNKKCLSIKSYQKLNRLVVERLCELIQEFPFEPRKPMGWMTRFIASLDSPLLRDEDAWLEQMKISGRRCEVRQPKDRQLTRLTFNQEEM